MGFWKNYRSTLLLLGGVVIGGIAGAIAGKGASVVKPVGDIFLNLIFVLVVPLVFFSIAQAMCSLKKSNLVGKVLGTAFGVFVVMSLFAGILSYVSLLVWNPFSGIEAAGSGLAAQVEDTSLGDAIVGTFTVSDFPLLLSKSNLLPLIIFASILGLAVASLEEKATVLSRLLQEGTSLIMKMMEIVMMAAPIGLGCYFADMIGSLGSAVVGSYLQVFVLYLVVSLFVYFVMHSLYVVVTGGSLRSYWKNILDPSLTAIATCSSAACMPINISYAKKMGVDESIAESVIPLGINLHKDGSVIAEVLKIVFALVFYSQFNPTFGSSVEIILLAILVSAVVGAVPIGGMTAEILICSVLGIDPSFAATLMVIGTIVDIPATLVNSTANVVGAYAVSSLVGKKGEESFSK
ncbi:MAG: dicarboxylate/amino acid:cation symporter [Bacteroidales bacterium]|nr:dicarboxylate/amino acid:cation symporter [Bacteroidales bacterium]